ncbi:nucleotidyltransferase family protein [Bacillus cereus]
MTFFKKDATSKGEITIKAGGIVVEYNPFHNGHLYHVQQTKKVNTIRYNNCRYEWSFFTAW